MKIYTSDSLAGLYKEFQKDLMDAKELSPRGMKTKEILCPQLVITNPRNRLALHPERKFSIKYALTESLLLFDNTNELKYFSAMNDNIANFSDDGEHLYGSYGYRISDSIVGIIEKLKEDNDTRQAVLPILRIEDVLKKTKDIPCTISLQLIIRDNKLNMICNMRSNDVIWGLPYDVFMFTMLQEVIANELGIDVGWYCHRPVSFHLYENFYDLFESTIHDLKNEGFKLPYGLETWRSIKDNYKDFVNGKSFAGANPVDTLYTMIKG